MLEAPDLPNERIISRVHEAYGLAVSSIAFLPLGADQYTAVYRAVANDGRRYFVKLRRAGFAEICVTLPSWLNAQGIAQIIAPLASKSGQLWTGLDEYALILYPFVEGRNGYAAPLSAGQWHAFGLALQRIHTTPPPPAIARAIPRDNYDPWGRTTVRQILAQLDQDTWPDQVARQLAAFLKTHRGLILDLVRRAERLAHALQERSLDFVVCHSDIHAGNILIDHYNQLYIVDWDNPILAPRERDLMFIGGGQGFVGYNAQEEENLFYRGYGRTALDQVALAYYRYERIIQDIAVFCEQLFSTTDGGDDRARSLRYLTANFLPNNTIAIAYAADRSHLRT